MHLCYILLQSMETYIKNTGAKICVSCNDPEKKQQSS